MDPHRTHRRAVRTLTGALLAAAALTACSDQPPATGGPAPDSPSVLTPTTQVTPSGAGTSEPPTGPAVTPPATWPAFSSSVGPVATERLATTWRPGCPVGADALRLVTLTYATFEGTAATGELILSAEVVDDVVDAFGELYAARFPIRKMITMEAYGGDDLRAAAEDNTSGFNCRPVLGTDRWSQHSYGYAVDINPLENPYLVGAEIRPPAGDAYLDRSDLRPGMIVEGDVVVQAFTSRGFDWGGRFQDTPDYQHFALPR